jgi:hypothetical protein
MAFLAIGVALLLPFPPAAAALELIARLTVGWVFFLFQVVPRAQVNPAMVVTAAACLVPALVGGHLFARWLVRSLPAANGEARRWSFRSTSALLGVIVLMFTAGIGAVGVTHQAGWLGNSPGPLFDHSTHNQRFSVGNLRDIGTAFTNYDSFHGHLPPAASFDARGRALHGWPTFMLPYLEEDNTFKAIDLSRPWDDLANTPHFRKAVRIYLHHSPPHGEPESLPLIHYALNARLVNGDRPLSLKQIAADRGTSNTLLLGEARGNWRPWGYPIHWRDPALGLNRSPDGFGSPARSAEPVAFVLADGSVRRFTSDADPAVMALLAAPAK